MAHLLVTGGAGYIGSHALRALRRAGHGVVVLDDLRAGTAAFAQGAPLVRADSGDAAALDRLFAARGPFDAVLHFAAYLSVGESVAKPLAYYANNVSGAAVLAGACVRHGVRAFVYSSSAAVYGDGAKPPIPEDAPLAPTSPYGASKAMTERILADVERAHGMRHTSLRYFNASGADPEGGIGERHDPETHLIPLALEAAAGLRPELVLFGTDWPTPDGTCVRDYVHVADLADAHLRALKKTEDASGAYNLGIGHGFSNREVIDAVSRVSGVDIPVEEHPRRPGDPASLVASNALAQSELGWRPEYTDLDSIVESAWRWHQAFPDGYSG